MTTVYDFTVKDNKGEDVSLDKYKGDVLLIVNTATECGFTPQYEELEALYKKYKDRGFEILDFPSNEFGGQAPGSDEEIESFCTLNFGTTFDRFSKIKVNGDEGEPLYKFLKSESKGILGDNIKRNFTKFLVDRNGNVVERYSPQKKPMAIEEDIEKLLG